MNVIYFIERLDAIHDACLLFMITAGVIFVSFLMKDLFSGLTQRHKKFMFIALAVLIVASLGYLLVPSTDEGYIILVRALHE